MFPCPLVAVAWLLLLSPRAAAQSTNVPAPLVDVYVVLEGDPLAQTANAGNGPVKAGLAELTRQRGATLQAQHRAQQPRIEAAGGLVRGHFTKVLNAVKVRVPADKVGALADLPGVTRVTRARHYKRSLAQSVPFIGTPTAWGSLFVSRADGRNVKIGIIDTGIDYNHADFGGSGNPDDYTRNNSSVIEPGTFPTAKVAGGYDFAGDAYNADNPAHSLPVPDLDPLDCYGHGTHVAGIAAGFGVLTDGRTYTGNYNSGLDFGRFLIGPGVAPRATLYALKVFGCEGTTDLVAEALEWAADPNGDNDFSDHLDVVNLSLGSDFGEESGQDPDIVAANNLALLGCVVVCAAGNSGNVFYVAGPPASASRTIAVANSTLDRTGGLQVTGPASIATNYIAFQGEFTAQLETNGPVTGKLVYVEPNDLCRPIQNGEAVKGNIALIDRGTCFFLDKVLAAQDAGAIAVVMVNNVSGQPFIMGGDVPVNIPGVMVSLEDGDLFKAHLAEGVTVRLDAKLVFQSSNLGDNLASSSSRGPGALGARLKPEIAAPGSGIVSAAFGKGTNGVNFSGTSMATPHVAGAAALLKQLHPNWPVEDIKAALMNTAVTAHDAELNPYPESWQGAGRVRVDLATTTDVTAATVDVDGNVAFALGSLVLKAPYEKHGAIRLSNHGSTEQKLQVLVVPTIAQAGVTITTGASEVTVPANGSATVPVTFRADPFQFGLTNDVTTPSVVKGVPVHTLFEASGGIHFLQPTRSLHVPYHASLRAASDFRATTNRIVLASSQSQKPQVDITVPISGSSATTNALVSAFQLGVKLSSQHLLSPYDSLADLLAIGVATDVIASGSIRDTTIYFGVAMATSWPTPRGVYVLPKILIDTNHDDVADFQVTNGDFFGPEPDLSAGDVFYTQLGRLDANGNVTAYQNAGVLNFYYADEADTAPFDNSVMVLPVQASDLGLKENQAQFRYRIVTSGVATNISSTGWIPFDAAQPVLDTAVTSESGLPFHADGAPVTARLNRAAAAENGQRLPTIMLLHHHNTEGKRLDLIQIDLSNDDTDHDGLPDWWEIQHFKNLTATDGSGDADHDGLTDRQEFQAGTDPSQAASALRILAARQASGQGIAVDWSSAPGKTYTLFSSTNLANGVNTPMARGIYATPPTNRYVDGNTNRSGATFYRVQVE